MPSLKTLGESHARAFLLGQIGRFRAYTYGMKEAETTEGNPRERTKASGQDESELLWTVQRAAEFLGVSAQTVYLWVERRSIPHFRIMGRNIRFLRSDLELFRGSFKQDIEPQ
jgi:excisionase family DNA binding protein